MTSTIVAEPIDFRHNDTTSLSGGSTSPCHSPTLTHTIHGDAGPHQPVLLPPPKLKNIPVSAQTTHGTFRGNSNRDIADQLRLADAMAISALLSSLNSGIDELVGSLNHFCQSQLREPLRHTSNPCYVAHSSSSPAVGATTLLAGPVQPSDPELGHALVSNSPADTKGSPLSLEASESPRRDALLNRSAVPSVGFDRTTSSQPNVSSREGNDISAGPTRASPPSVGRGVSMISLEVPSIRETLRVCTEITKQMESDSDKRSIGTQLMELASVVDRFLLQTAGIRESAKRLCQKLSCRPSGTQSTTFVGNSRYNYTMFNMAPFLANQSNQKMTASSHRLPDVEMAAQSPQTQSPLLGRPRGALKLARVESIASRAGLRSDGFAEPLILPPVAATSLADLLQCHNATSTTDEISDTGLDVKVEASQEFQGDGNFHPFGSTNSLYSRTGNQSTAAAIKALETATLDVGHDQEGNKLINNYLVIGELGRGSYGKVKLCEHRITKELFAIKILKKSMLRKIRNGMSTAFQQVQMEIAIMKKLRHRNIVNLYEVIDDPSSNKMYLVMQYVPNGPVLKLTKEGSCSALDERTTKSFARQLAAGINYLHRHNVVHRDIKPDNILLGEEGRLYLADFGVSEMLDEDTELITGFQGTPAFMSPELCRGEGSVHGKAVDMWALGITLYAFLFGKLPFFGDSFAEIAHAVQNNALVFPPNADPTWRALLSALLNKDPNHRMTASELRMSPVLFEDEYMNGSVQRHSVVTTLKPSDKFGRRDFGLEVVTVDYDDIENAITVGSRVQLSHHQTPREKLHGYVEGVRRRVHAGHRQLGNHIHMTSAKPVAIEGLITTTTATGKANANGDAARITPHPPTSPAENDDDACRTFEAVERRREPTSPSETGCAGGIRTPLQSPNQEVPSTPKGRGVTGASLRSSHQRSAERNSVAVNVKQ